MIDTDRMSRRLLRGNYERVSQRLLRGQPKAKPFGRVIDGVWSTGTKSLHRTPQSLKWRLFWRIKHVRNNQNDPLNKGFWRW